MRGRVAPAPGGMIHENESRAPAPRGANEGEGKTSAANPRLAQSYTAHRRAYRADTKAVLVPGLRQSTAIRWAASL